MRFSWASFQLPNIAFWMCFDEDVATPLWTMNSCNLESTQTVMVSLKSNLYQRLAIVELHSKCHRTYRWRLRDDGPAMMGVICSRFRMSWEMVSEGKE